MTSHSTMREQPQLETEAAAQLFDNWFDPIEAGLRDRAREFLQAMLEGELDEVLDRSRYARRAKRSADAVGNIRPAEDRGAARSAGNSGRQDNRVEEPDAASLSAPHAGGRRADRRLLSFRHQYAPGASGATCPVWRCGRQGRCEPGLAQGEERLGGLECPPAGG